MGAISPTNQQKNEGNLRLFGWNCGSHLLTWLAEAAESVLLVDADAVNTRRGLALIQAVLAKRSCEPGSTVAAAGRYKEGLLLVQWGVAEIKQKKRRGGRVSERLWNNWGFLNMRQKSTFMSKHRRRRLDRTAKQWPG